MNPLIRCQTPTRPTSYIQENPIQKQPTPLAKKRAPSLATLITNSPSKPDKKERSKTLTIKEITEISPKKEQGIVIRDTTANLDQLQRLKKCAQAGNLIPPPQTGNTGANGALFLRDPSNKKNEFVTKFDYREQGTTFGQKIRPDVPYSKLGIEPKEGAFTEHLSACLWKEWLQETAIPSSEIFVPTSSFCEMGHPNLYSQIPPTIQVQMPEDAIPYSVGSNASVHLFFDKQCTSFKDAKKEWPKGWESTLSARSVQMITLFDLALLNTDRNEENLLLHKAENGEIQLIPIDNALNLPRPHPFHSAISPVTTCFKNRSQLKQPLDPALKKFVLNTLSSDSLLYHLERMQRKGIEEAISFGPQRILMHKIAISLLKEGIKQELSLYEITKLFIQDPNSFAPITAPSIIYTELNKSPSLSIENCAQKLIEDYKEKCLQGEERLALDDFYASF